MPDWDTSLVTNMAELFMDATSFNVDISGWDVSSVTKMRTSGSFRARRHSTRTAFNADHSGWDVSSVREMDLMFEEATAFNADLSSWDVSSVGVNIIHGPSHGRILMFNMFHGAAMSLIPNWYTLECPAGHIGGDGQVCSSCVAGKSTGGVAGTATCAPCAPGHWAAKAGTSTCTPCAAGHSTVGTTGSVSCTACVGGMSTDGAMGAATCTPCAAGHWTAEAGTLTCTPCAAWHLHSL